MDRRAALDDKLIFDVLMVAGGIRDPDFLYPPRDVQGLERLLGAIESSTYDSLKKNTLVYYLLKWHQDGRENNFKVQTAIPPQFSALADAYWNLDSGTNIPVRASRPRDDAFRVLKSFSFRKLYPFSLIRGSTKTIAQRSFTPSPCHHNLAH